MKRILTGLALAMLLCALDTTTEGATTNTAQGLTTATTLNTAMPERSPADANLIVDVAVIEEEAANQAAMTANGTASAALAKTAKMAQLAVIRGTPKLRVLGNI